jgi:acyl phosphate:glycerol-3-phosphate acyltransferase
MSFIPPLLAAYLVGAVPFALLLGRAAGRDIRAEGSRNIGATNCLRVCGARWGVPALLLDMGKGALAVLLVRFGVFSLPAESRTLCMALAGLAAVLGHTFPVYLGFRGGKGVATAAGVFLALIPAAAGVAVAVFFLTVALTRYVSMGSSLAAAAIVAAHHGFSGAPYGEDLPLTVLTWLVFVLVAVRHRSNYGRLLRGTENRFGSPKPSAAGEARPADADAEG